MNEITYEQAGQSTDADVLFEYCIQGVEDDIHVNGGHVSDWKCPSHIVDMYLGHNEVADESVLSEVCAKLNKFLDENRAA